MIRQCMTCVYETMSVEDHRSEVSNEFVRCKLRVHSLEHKSGEEHRRREQCPPDTARHCDARRRRLGITGTRASGWRGGRGRGGVRGRDRDLARDICKKEVDNEHHSTTETEHGWPRLESRVARRLTLLERG